MKFHAKWILPLVLTFLIYPSQAQERSIVGKVTDQDDVPLPGVAVVVKGTDQGTQTDFDGNYVILTLRGQVLQFIYLGQETEERIVGTSDVINVQMREDVRALDEVIVQGYRTSPKEKSSIAVQTISGEDITTRPNANFAQSLSGQVAGLNITTSSGQPGIDTQINLRGVGSVNGNTEPLFIIDGAPVDEDNFRSLNPNDIAKITVLKDAGATAIYGNRGANGVVIINTRTGNFNAATAINYIGQINFSTLQNNDYDLMNSQEQLRLEREFGNGRGANFSDGQIFEAPNFDWAEFFFRTAVTQNHTLNISGGGEHMNSFTSLGFGDIQGILQDSDLQRFNVRNNITGKSSNGRFNYGSNFTINFSQSNEPNNIGSGAINRNYVLGAYTSVPYITPDDYVDGAALLSPLTFSNTPLFLLDRLRTFTRKEEEVKIIGTFSASYKFTDQLTAKIVMSTDYRSEHLTVAEGPESFNALLFGGDANPTSGFQQQDTRRTFTYNQVTSLNYLQSFGKHTMDLSVFIEYFKAHYRRFGYTANGLNPKTFFPGDGDGFISDNAENDLFVDTIRANILNSGLFSYFGQGDYDYDGKYGLTTTVRRDASFRFSGSNRWATFWSLAGRWNVHNESFMVGSAFDVLKLRGSIGTAGNQNIVDVLGFFAPFSAPDLYLDLFATANGYGGQNAIIPLQLGNTLLRWETIKQANIGIDFEVFERRLRGSIDGYIKTTEDLFQDRPLSAVNAQTILRANVGSLENRGIDLTLNYDVLRGGQDGLRISVGVNGNYNKQENLEVPTEDGTVVAAGALQGRREGGPLNEYFTYRYAGVNPANGNLLFLTADGELTENPNVDTDRVWLNKNVFPDYQGGITLDADYKGFFLTTQWNYVIGVDRFDYDLFGFQDPTAIGQFRTSRDLLRAWTVDNRITDIPALRAENLALGINSTRFLREADYLRLRFASLGYNFSEKQLDKTGINTLRIFLNTENIITFSKWRGFDAEGALSTGSNLYPTPKIVSLGIEIGL